MDNERKLNLIYKQIIKEIKPTELEVRAATAQANELMERLKEIVPRDVELRITGSISRGTNLRGSTDIDIFMLFPKGTPREKLVNDGVRYGKALGDKNKGESFEIKYAEHPYVRLFLNNTGLRADIVPALAIDSFVERITSVDRTPLHTKFINERLTEKQRDDVRIMKYLMKNYRIYGAEVKTEGFPGYLCELLIYQFGSLTSLLTNFSNLKLPAILDPSTKSIDMKDDITKTFNSDFVVIDPVDPRRNVAAGVSKESLARFVLIARKILDNPRKESFYGYRFSSATSHRMFMDFLIENGLDSHLLICNVPKKSEDIIWPQLRKLRILICNEIKASGFSYLLGTQWISGRNGSILIITPKQKMVSRILKGPPVFIGKASSEFISRHKKADALMISDDTIYALERTRFRTVSDLLKLAEKGTLVKKRPDVSTKGCKILVNKIPKSMADDAYSELLRCIKI
jgi:tRNA nucleotidyltransferase (CCA-adding enzyme)